MGRHSAPDEDLDDREADGAGDLDLADDVATSYRGTHAAAEQASEQEPDAPAARGGTRADLALVRTQPGVRWSCLGAVVTAFALYTVVMAVTGRVDRYLLWVWIPIVVSGVLVGVVLDVAHSRRRRTR